MIANLFICFASGLLLIRTGGLLFKCSYAEMGGDASHFAAALFFGGAAVLGLTIVCGVWA